jgi:hypothetical protein
MRRFPVTLAPPDTLVIFIPAKHCTLSGRAEAADFSMFETHFFETKCAHFGN